MIELSCDNCGKTLDFTENLDTLMGFDVFLHRSGWKEIRSPLDCEEYYFCTPECLNKYVNEHGWFRGEVQ